MSSNDGGAISSFRTVWLEALHSRVEGDGRMCGPSYNVRGVRGRP